MCKCANDKCQSQTLVIKYSAIPCQELQPTFFTHLVLVLHLHICKLAHFHIDLKIIFIQSQLSQVHSELQTPFIQHLLNFSQGFLSEVAELHQVFLLVLN